MNKKNFIGFLALTMLALSLNSCTKTVYVPQGPYDSIAARQQNATYKNSQGFYNSDSDNTQRCNASLLNRVSDNRYPVAGMSDQKTTTSAYNHAQVRPVNQPTNRYPAQPNSVYTSQDNTPVNVTNVSTQNYPYPTNQTVNNYPTSNRPNKAPIPPQQNNQYSAVTEPVTIASYTNQNNFNTQSPVVQQDYDYPNAPKPRNNSGYEVQNNPNVPPVVNQNYQYPNAPKPKNKNWNAVQNQQNNAMNVPQQNYQYTNAAQNTYNYAQSGPIQAVKKDPLSDYYGQRVIIFFKNGAKLDGSLAKHPSNVNKVIITLADQSVYETATKDIDKVQFKK